MNNNLSMAGVLCLFSLVSGMACANPDVTSREYKVLLSSNNFNYNSEANQVDSYFSAFGAAVESAINRNVNGAMSLDKNRVVKFYDTAGSCQLNSLGYIFRDRIENGQSEVTLKFRSPDRYIAYFEDLSASSSQAKTKLEADISSKGTDTFKVVYSHSTTSENTRTINDLRDVNYHFPGFDSDYSLSDSLALSQVGNLTIFERVYKGGTIDLGSIEAEVSITLWYNGTPSGSLQPIIAEASFKYEDTSADYTQKVVNRAKQAFESMLTLSNWNSASGASKTQAVYQYQPGFCH